MPKAARHRAIVQSKFRELALGIAVERLAGDESIVAQPHAAAIVELDFRPAAGRHPNLAALPQRHIPPGGRPTQIRVGAPAYVAIQIVKACQAYRTVGW